MDGITAVRNHPLEQDMITCRYAIVTIIYLLSIF
jgi:hypothetical protein